MQSFSLLHCIALHGTHHVDITGCKIAEACESAQSDEQDMHALTDL